MEAKEQSDEVKNFSKKMKPFMVQAIVGTMMAHVRANVELEINGMTYSYIMYLNTCWHNWNKKDDPYVVETVKDILDANVIKGSVCLFHWFKEIGLAVLSKIDFKDPIPKGGSIDLKRDVLRAVVGKIYDIGVAPTFKNGMKCSGDKCSDKYDGSDFFLFKKD
ncbi:MAG: hypothetical protein Hyperionvirus26_16 [Hyperionvirus sp.]|uniref:Uncharacterized protein n=1 Tax=Hyperionvirus sp. TaxID=2487770 RepID=A0A3G5ADW4_9VIRU|nr:MAG: hypothetical protein Hyperionvirus26_16 [Hyperionvirus sp.]